MGSAGRFLFKGKVKTAHFLSISKSFSFLCSLKTFHHFNQQQLIPVSSCLSSLSCKGHSSGQRRRWSLKIESANHSGGFIRRREPRPEDQPLPGRGWPPVVVLFASERNFAAASVSLFSSVAPKLDRIEPQQCLLVFFCMTQRRFEVAEQSFLHQPTSPNPPDDLQQVSVLGQLNL